MIIRAPFMTRSQMIRAFINRLNPCQILIAQIQTDTFDFKAELLKLKGNKYVIYGLVGLGILIGIKIVLR